jgi:phosphate-selective porin
MMKNNQARPTPASTRTPPIAHAVRVLLLAVSVLTLAACAATGPKTPPVVERAQARWNALLAGDLETAYGYYSPGYRSATSMVDFSIAWRARKVGYTSAAYKEHTCEEKRCTVAFDVGFKVNKPVPGLDVWESHQVIGDTWIQTDGEWWYLPEK